MATYSQRTHAVETLSRACLAFKSSGVITTRLTSGEVAGAGEGDRMPVQIPENAAAGMYRQAVGISLIQPAPSRHRIGASVPPGVGIGAIRRMGSDRHLASR